MRRFICFCFLCFVCISNSAMGAADDIDTPYVWSLGAVGDTIDEYYRHRCHVGLPETTKMGSLIRDAWKNKKKLSKRELYRVCSQERVFMQKNLYEATKEDTADTCKGPAVALSGDGEWQHIPCWQFVQMLSEKQKEYAKKGTTNLMYSSPGTYIKKTDKCGGAAYQVVNVVPGNDTDNAIYLINENGNATRWKYNTQKNGTFINETAQLKDVDAGQIRGVYNGSYILPVDVTSNIYEMYNSGRGIPGYSLATLFHLNDEGDYDVKRIWTKKTCDLSNLGFKVTDQTDAQTHTNGVIFEGQIVTLENLGHIITGMHQADSSVPDGNVDYAAEALQGINNEGGVLDWGLKMATGKAEIKIPTASESPYANSIRYDAKQKTQQAKDDTTFKDIKTEKEQDAYNMARNHMAQKYNLDAQKITCSGKCNTNLGTDDFVTCYYKNGEASKVVVYKFDSICKVSLL